jgi:beta-ureidopropionase / N-carbamoyl-L-amino-acid hydrolase
MNRRRFTQQLAAAVGAISLGRTTRGEGTSLATSLAPGLGVDGERINRQLLELAQFGKNPYGGVSRVAYSEFDRQGREWAMNVMREARLAVNIDAAGNIFGRRPGNVATLKPLVFGSHIDSVPDGGNYDGDVGSLSAIEVARTLAANNLATRHPLEVVIFQNEEGGTVGSRALVGELTADDLLLKTQSGKTIGDGVTFLNGDLSKLASVKRAAGGVAAYVELHIEQGGNLDREKIDIGVVEGIVGIGQWEVTAEGVANHAGTTAMSDRRDSLLATARYVDMVNRVITSTPGRQVGTVGRVQAFPGAPNVIPGKVIFTLEIRDLDQAKVEALSARVRGEGEAIGRDTGCTFAYASLHDSRPAVCDDRVKDAIETSARGLGLSTRHLPSGAGHDAQHMARLGPTGMIFVPSVGGISHAPKEFTKPQDVVNGANVLLRTILALDTAAWT